MKKLLVGLLCLVSFSSEPIRAMDCVQRNNVPNVTVEFYEPSTNFNQDNLNRIECYRGYLSGLAMSKTPLEFVQSLSRDDFDNLPDDVEFVINYNINDVSLLYLRNNVRFLNDEVSELQKKQFGIENYGFGFSESSNVGVINFGLGKSNSEVFEFSLEIVVNLYKQTSQLKLCRS